MLTFIWDNEDDKKDTFILDGKFYSKDYLKRLLWQDRELFRILKDKTDSGTPILVTDPTSYLGNDYVLSIIKENTMLKLENEILMRGD